ncbi:hypothetical protein OG589_40990 [Sphaerisporangium sp. NBC_01403]|uniref:hypothetical protein n=1 Tax=Sphaerisporangium sp. NBC_01403 TaxID=2903599 RepID=UPI00324752F0
MRRYLGFRQFVSDTQQGLLGTACLLTGSGAEAESLVRSVYGSIGADWARLRWQDPVAAARGVLYRRVLAAGAGAGGDAGGEAGPLSGLPLEDRVLLVASHHEGVPLESTAWVLGMATEPARERLAAAEAVLELRLEGRSVAEALAEHADRAPEVADLAEGALASVRKGRAGRAAILVVVVAVIAAGALYLNRDKPDPEYVWKPGPFDPPVQYAYVPQTTACADSVPPSEEQSAIHCTEWKVFTAYKQGQSGRMELGTWFGEGCGDDGCSADIDLVDAVNSVHTRERGSSVPLRVSPDGHRIAYFSKARSRFVAWDLPSARMVDISPPVPWSTLLDVAGLDMSPDGRVFAVAFGGTGPRVLITDFTTGTTSAMPGYCGVIGMAREGATMALRRECPEFADELTETPKTVVMIDRNRKVTKEFTATGVDGLSPDGRTLAGVLTDFDHGDEQYFVTTDPVTGRVNERFPLKPLSEPSYSFAREWLGDREYLVNAVTEVGHESFGFYAVDVRTGKSERVRDVGLNPGSRVEFGKIRRDK